MSDDDRLLGRSARDPEVFGVLVTRHQDALFGYLARRAPEAAPDLLGEVWLRAFASRATFDAKRGGARGWLFGVARHVLLSHWRSKDTHIAFPATRSLTTIGLQSTPASTRPPWHPGCALPWPPFRPSTARCCCWSRGSN